MLTSAICRANPANRLRGAAKDHAELSASEHALGLALELPYALARDAELVGELGEGGGVAVAQAVAPHQHVAVALGQPPDGLLQGAHLHLAYDGARHLRGPLVLYELA